jgi:DNA ligase-1
MKRFAELYQTLDQTTSSRLKTEHMAAYFKAVQAAHAAWAVYFLAGGKLKRLVATQQLRQYAQMQTAMPDWLFEACYQNVGDLAETITLVLPPGVCTRHDGLQQWVEDVLLPMRAATPEARTDALHEALNGWDSQTRFVCLKLLTGGFRVGVSKLLVTRALALAFELPVTLVAQRLVGYLRSDSEPDASQFLALVDPNTEAAFSPGQPYPFFLAQSLQLEHHGSGDVPGDVPGDEGSDTRADALVEALAQTLGDVHAWQLEHKLDGIRAQLVKRAGQVWLWSRGEELIGEQFPELVQAGQGLPDGTVLDGEVLVWPNEQDKPASFADLQKRLGRKQISARMLAQYPAVLVVYDLLEQNGHDLRAESLSVRRRALESLLDFVGSGLKLSPVLSVCDWRQALVWQQSARDYRAEGLMIKALDSRYGIGRTRAAGLWFKFKLDPLSIDAVLIYAQKGHGRRANLYTDYTFAVWHQSDAQAPATLVPIAKAYSGLTDEEFRQVDAIIKKSTVESFGPVRRVEPTLVFEIGFEGILPSTRHKSGVALRFPRMLRWRTDKPVEQADTLEQLKAWL